MYSRDRSSWGCWSELFHSHEDSENRSELFFDSHDASPALVDASSMVRVSLFGNTAMVPRNMKMEDRREGWLAFDLRRELLDGAEPENQPGMARLPRRQEGTS